MANTLKKIQTVTVGSGGAATIDFTSIPATYTDLKIVASLRTNRAFETDGLNIKLNGTNGTSRRLFGDGVTASSDSQSEIRSTAVGNTAVASVFSNIEINIPNYTSANHKLLSIDGVGEDNAAAAIQMLSVGLWSNTAVVNQVTLLPVIGTSFNQYSTATLYGVANYSITNPGGKATGGIVTEDNNYWYHTFVTSGTLNVISPVTVDYLVVAGGAGGGWDGGGGGGAGGLRCTVGATGGGGSLESALSLTTQAYTVSVGAGGAGGTSGSPNGGAGSNSVLSTITSTGGGPGGGNSTNGLSGGSGGGAGQVGSLTTGGAGTANQGFAGGSQQNDNGGGGGGGAGAVGGTAVGTANAGAGGSGVATSISGSSITYAGGGGGGAWPSPATGGAGGAGGGGAGGNATPNQSGFAATVNTGGGGGGMTGGGTVGQIGGAGGSGIVIVRYAK